MRFRLLAVLLVLPGLVLAQRGGGGGRGRGGGDGMSTPVSFSKNRMEQISDLLQLSKEQKKDVKTIMDDAHKEAAPLRDQLVKGRASVAAAIQSGKQNELERAVKTQGEADARMTAIEMKAFAGIYKSLDDGQKQKARGLFVMMPGMFSHKNWLDVEF
jgi:Spy/CpxP family protein refolding chaperone